MHLQHPRQKGEPGAGSLIANEKWTLRCWSCIFFYRYDLTVHLFYLQKTNAAQKKAHVVQHQETASLLCALILLLLRGARAQLNIIAQPVYLI